MWNMFRTKLKTRRRFISARCWIYLFKKINNKRRYRVRQTSQKRKVHGVDKFLKNLQEDDVGLNQWLVKRFGGWGGGELVSSGIGVVEGR